MKKFLSIAMILVMMLSLSLSAAAATQLDNSTGVTGPLTGDVEISINPLDDPEIPGDDSVVYAVELVWQSLEFTYTGKWDPEEVAYTGTWDKTSANIDVTNSSNKAVDIDAYFGDTPNTTVAESNGVRATLANFDFRLNAASDMGVAQTKAITVSVNGAPKVTTGFTLATVNVLISTVD